MSKLLRYFSEGNIYFVTAVTKDRTPLLIDYYQLFKDSLEKHRTELEFNLMARIILPDHFHMIIDPRKNCLSDIMQRIKLSFSKKYRYEIAATGGDIWQRRFWDHVIRNEKDLNRHIDYIHYNPVKHGFVKDPFDWKHSSIHDYLLNGFYSRDWGCEGTLSFGEGFGE